MQKVLFLLFFLYLFFSFPSSVLAEEKADVDYYQVMENLPMPKVTFIHREDPDDYYDNRKFYFSPYPLIRLSDKLYFKDTVIMPDYYLMTPRQYADIDVMLFKQAGKIVHVIPIYEKESVPFEYYPKSPKKWYHRIIKDKYDDDPDFPKSKIKAFDLYSPFYEIDVYYEGYKYKMIFKKTPDIAEENLRK